MNTTLRMSNEEQERIDELSFKLNSLRVKNRKKPLMESKIAHELLEMALDTVDVNDDGNLYYRKLGKIFIDLFTCHQHIILNFKKFFNLFAISGNYSKIYEVVVYPHNRANIAV